MGWVIPALKAILPHVGTIIAEAKPAFSRAAAGSAPPEEQMAELQKAIMQNAEHIQALAEQLRKTVTALEEEAERLERRLERAYWACGAATLVSLAAVGLALAAWVGR